MAQILGYARISSRDQNESRQLVALQEFGVHDNNVYLDKLSGKDFERPAYRRLLRKLKPGDTLVTKSIDRLGRNYDEILEQWRVITKEKLAAIVVLEAYVKQKLKNSEIFFSRYKTNRLSVSDKRFFDAMHKKRILSLSMRFQCGHSGTHGFYL